MPDFLDLGSTASAKSSGGVIFGSLDQSKLDAKTLVTFDKVDPLGGNVSADCQDIELIGRTAIFDTSTTESFSPLLQTPKPSQDCRVTVEAVSSSYAQTKQ